MSGSRRSDALRRTLLVLQAAVFAVLLTGASAFVVSLRRASSVSFGFDIGSVISARIPMPADVPRSDARALMERARDGVAALPGVESASLGYMEPFQNNTSVPISVPGSTVTPPYTMFDMVTPEYLHTFGVRMRDGRWFTASDGAASEPVIVINEALEHIYWPTGGAVGRCMRVGADSMPCRIIVGVVRDFRVTGGADDAARPIYYLPYAQTAGFRQLPTLFVRPRGEPATISQSVRQALQSLQPNLQAVSVHPVSDNVTWLTAPLRLGAAAFTAFGIVAAIVGAVGLYSMLAFMIVERSRAYAIRLAIGAAPVRLARSVVRYALVTVGVGMIAGAVLLVPLARVLEPLLFHTRVLDVRALLAVALLGLLTTLVATISPVRAVVRTDVMRVLREQ